MGEICNYHRVVSDYFFTGREIPEGEIGIEIEVEGSNLPQNLGSYWSVHRDGSLRGESAEYVLTKPTKRDNVLSYLKYLSKRLEDSVVNDSIRTSVHVHFNQSHRTILEIYVILTVYFILEDLVVTLAGEQRVGNLFCLRAKDAEFLLDILEQAARHDNYQLLNNEAQLRYAAVNICALGKFNSLEFRAMRGTVNPQVIFEWVSLLATMIDTSLRYYKTPLDVIQDFSAVGPQRFMRKILEHHAESLKIKDVDRVLWEGLRLTQSLAYCRTWDYSDYRPVKRVFQRRRTETRPDRLSGDEFDEPREIRPLRTRTIARPSVPSPRSFYTTELAAQLNSLNNAPVLAVDPGQALRWRDFPGLEIREN